MAVPFPDISPVAVQLGPLAIRWYALAYVAGLLLGWRYAVRLTRRQPGGITPRHLDDFLMYAMIGILLGGRLGYVLLYQWPYYRDNLSAVLRLWEGGMAFHGGLAGVIIAMVLFARNRGLEFWRLADLIAAATPIGLFFGRLANFINGELYGRAASVPWAVVFPHGGGTPRHPSQLYEAVLEGLLLFALLAWLITRRRALDFPGLCSGVFLAGYALSRILVEFFREPDSQIGYYAGLLTQGQLLSLPMLLFGGWLVWRSGRHRSKNACSPAPS